MRVLVGLSGAVVVMMGIVTTTLSAVPPHQHSQHFPNKRQAEYAASLESYEVITPMRVDREGGFLSHHLHHTHDAHTRRKRQTLWQEHHLHYIITLDGKDHQVSLRPSRGFLAPHAVLERRRRDIESNSNVSSTLQIIGTEPSCHYHGFVANHTSSRVAVSACEGLTGYVLTDDDEYLIEPVRDYVRPSPEHPHPHLVYKRSALPSSDSHTCSTSDAFREGLRARARWESDQRRKRRSVSDGEDEEGDISTNRRRRRKRSVSVERNVEVTVVADKKMVDYYSNEDIKTYILTVMNMVSSVYHDASIGNAVNIYVVRIMLLEDPQYEEELDISHNADNTLRSFCQWQQMINPGNETHPYHHDVAVLITRYNICSKMTDRCSTLGVAEIAGMCQPHRSCNVNEDTGLQIAYTIAHELGHNFGMNHDGPQNGCESQYGVSQHVMSPHLTSEPIPVTWSNCSRKEITHFLDRDWGACLEDDPPEVEYNFPELPPGAMYDADHQCRLSFGAGATHCSGIEGIERICQTLWCHLDNRCITRMEPAAEGTQCGKHKWCVMGRCVMMGERPAAIHGNWGSWSSWSPCSRSCGAGTSMAHRHCDNPAPANGGKYCTGDRKRYKICSTQECPENGLSFRAIQCSEFDKQPYKGANHTWLPVMFDHSPCQLECKPDNEFYSVKLKDTVLDGTPCKPGTKDMCIHGMCKRITCDWTIEGNAQEDRCGLCHGDGTQCVTTRGTFNVTRGSGYVPVVTFPQDARNVKVTELEDAANFLAVTNNSTGKYFLNGHWIIQWSGEYYADGTMIYYSREGETEELFFPGPLKQPLTLMLLFQTENPGLEWEYTLPHENATYTPSFDWEFSDWTVCSATCGGGKQISKVQCMEKEAGLVEDKYCSNQTKPEDRYRICNSHACPAWWWSGPWQPCSVTCGEGGIRRRTVICVRSFGPTEQMALLDSDCNNNEKPHEAEMCGLMSACPVFQDWSVGPWSQECSLDPCDFEEREVQCVASGGTCDPLTRPPSRRQCGNISCGNWEVGEWSKCSAHCGEGAQFRRVSCVGGLACRERDEPKSVQECIGECLEEETLVEVEMENSAVFEPTIATPSVLTNITSTASAIPMSVAEVGDNSTTTPPPHETVLPSAYPSTTEAPTTTRTPKVELTTQEVSSTHSTNVSENTLEEYSSTTLPSPVTQTTLQLNATTVSPTEQMLDTVEDSESVSENTTSDILLVPTTMGTDEELLFVNETEADTVGENDSEAVVDEMSDDEHIFENDTDAVHTTDTTNDTIAEISSTIVPNFRNETEKLSPTLANETIPDEYIKIENTDETLPEDIPHETLNEIDIDSKPMETENLDITSDKAPYSSTTPSPLAIPEERISILIENQEEEDPTITEITDDSDDERPDGIIEDKINLEDFEVIEVIEVPADGKRKKDKKKVLIHTGEEAVDVLHDIAEEQDAKRMSTISETEVINENYQWIVGDWTKCSAECGGGIQGRNVECNEMYTLAPAEPELCKEEKPHNFQICNEMECGEWIVGEWEECSADCDVGERQRPVSCPEGMVCPSHTQPPEVEPCNLGPCAKWVEGPWSLCTKSCGGGYQIRHVKCVDVRTQEPARTCPRETKPKHKMACHGQRCPKKERGQQKRCRDHMDSKLCRRLKHMCSTNFFRIKCCRTCFKGHLPEKSSEKE